MIRTRILFGSALPILGLAAAAMLVGPDLVTGPRGEPMIVASPAEATLQQASFDTTVCPTPLLLDDEALLADQAEPDVGTHVVTLAFRYTADGASMLVEDGATHPDADEALVIVFDDQGRILTVDQPPTEGCLGIEAGPGAAKI
jgi:hypothetical protein